MMPADAANLASRVGELGNLRFISKRRVMGVCRECANPVPIGDKCFMQSDHRNVGPEPGQDSYPVQTLLCFDCGMEQKDKGKTIKNPELFDKIVKPQPLSQGSLF